MADKQLDINEILKKPRKDWTEEEIRTFISHASTRTVWNNHTTNTVIGENGAMYFVTPDDIPEEPVKQNTPTTGIPLTESKTEVYDIRFLNSLSKKFDIPVSDLEKMYQNYLQKERNEHPNYSPNRISSIARKKLYNKLKKILKKRLKRMKKTVPEQIDDAFTTWENQDGGKSKNKIMEVVDQEIEYALNRLDEAYKDWEVEEPKPEPPVSTIERDIPQRIRTLSEFFGDIPEPKIPIKRVRD